jgi:hypothetical protein
MRGRIVLMPSGSLLTLGERDKEPGEELLARFAALGDRARLSAPGEFGRRMGALRLRAFEPELAEVVEFARQPLDLEADGERPAAQPDGVGLEVPDVGEALAASAVWAASTRHTKRAGTAERKTRGRYLIRPRQDRPPVDWEVTDRAGRVVPVELQPDGALVASASGMVLWPAPSRRPPAAPLAAAARPPVEPEVEPLATGSSRLEMIAAFARGVVDRMSLVAKAEADAEVASGRVDRLAQAVERLASRQPEPVQVNLPAPIVNVPEQPAPIVNVRPPEVVVNVEAPRPRAVRVEFDDDGNKRYVVEEVPGEG